MYTNNIYFYVLYIWFILLYSVMEILGKGQFARVNRGIWTKPDGEELEVAVKVVSEVADERDRIRFLQEAALMGQFTHTNVLTLHGVVTNEGNKVRNREREREREREEMRI